MKCHHFFVLAVLAFVLQTTFTDAQQPAFFAAAALETQSSVEVKDYQRIAEEKVEEFRKQFKDYIFDEETVKLRIKDYLDKKKEWETRSGSRDDPIDPFIYLNESYDVLAAIPNAHAGWGTMIGADGYNDKDDFLILWSGGNVGFFHEDETVEYKAIPTLGSSGVSEMPSSYPGVIAVTDNSGIWFYDDDGNFQDGWGVISPTIADISYDSQWDRILISHNDGIGYRNPDMTLTELFGFGPDMGIEFIDMESDPLTYDMLQREDFFTKFELDGTLQTVGSFGTNLAEHAIIHGIAYTNNFAFMAIEGGFLIYGKLEFQDHMQGPTPPTPGDCDGDTDVDLSDFLTFQTCYTGPAGGPLGPECECVDFDEDDDVDLQDFFSFQVAYTGPS